MNHAENENQSLDSSSLLRFNRSNQGDGAAANGYNVALSGNNRLSSSFIPSQNRISRINKEINSVRPLSSSLALNSFSNQTRATNEAAQQLGATRSNFGVNRSSNFGGVSFNGQR